MRESAGANNVMVVIKIAAILIFVFGAARAVNTANWHPFLPNGFSGVLTGAAIVFFTYIGFDSVSTAAEECRHPQRDLPFGIIMTLVVCAILYVAVALVLTGIVHWNTLDNAAPVANALKALGFNRVRQWVTVGRHGRDDLVAAGVPVRAGAHLVRHVARPPAARMPSRGCTRSQDAARQHLDRGVSRSASRRASGTSARLADLTNIGTLFAFVVVSVGCHRAAAKAARPPARLPRPLRAVSAVALDRLLPGADAGLPLETWLRFVVWLADRPVDLLPFRPQTQHVGDG